MHRQHICSNEARRNAVDATIINPLNRQTPRQLDQPSLRCVVRGLLLRHIDQYRTDRRRKDQVAKTLWFEDPGSRLSGEERPVKVDLHDLAPLLGRVLFGRVVRGNASVCDDDIELAKVLRYLL